MSSRTLLLVLVLATAPLAAFAQSSAPAAPLPSWEQLTPAQRELLLAPVRERWNDSPPGKRQHMLEHAQRWQAMTPEQRRHARHGMKRWRDMPPEKREQARALFEHTRGLPEAERKAMIARWKAMTPEQRKAWVEAHPPGDPPQPRSP
ncbi:DUF3106 domain-containing protein [Luteimonas viscosa]|uniref:DUF3106 domain-containing protein n=1 Tax=Luteimonas viscosa TaxID=1132694 RepID=A0A5D4XFY0_9GAMM|nr:DUF3106 domain-containing protein [Luteimonas viscosa]TYT23144.1 DUF3106 domain-containing protein [Luteimonas viscosa]